MIRFRGWDCVLQRGRYRNGRTVLRLVGAEDGDPVATATVDLPDRGLADDEVAIKSYGENAGLLDALTAAGVVEPTGRVVVSGLVALPVCRVLVKE